MPKVVKRTFSLTEEQAKFIDGKVEDGTFASGSEVVRDGLRGLQQREQAIERWLRDEVVPVYDRIKRGEGKLLTPQQVRQRVQAKIEAKAKAAE
jgi:antitoxin ParD1/3/4